MRAVVVNILEPALGVRLLTSLVLESVLCEAEEHSPYDIVVED